MEASERPQLPLDEAEAEGSVRVVEDRIQIENLEITDGQTARVVRERAESGEEPARAVRRAIEIGARVLDREDTAVEVDYVRREFEQLQSIHRDTVEQQNREAVERIEENLQKALGDGDVPGALGSRARVPFRRARRADRRDLRRGPRRRGSGSDPADPR